LAADSRHRHCGVLAVDAAPPHSYGDLAAVLGAVAPTAEITISERLSLLGSPAGEADTTDSDRFDADILSALSNESRTVIVDAGSIETPRQHQLAEAAARSLLVLRPCYLTLRRVAGKPLAAHGVVLIEEPGRSLQRDDVEAVLELPVLARIPLDPAIARSIDSGLLTSRIPRQLNSLRHLPWN
jgi:hypothetical protein